MQGWRPEMEDTHVLVDMPMCPAHTLCAIFDGHNGIAAAKFAAQNINHIIETSPSWKAYSNAGNNEERSDLLREALTRTLCDLDQHFFLKCPSDSLRSGSTAVMCIITPTLIACANAGDSRCVLGSQDEVLALSTDHRPDVQEESDRIRRAGGTISFGRVGGDISVTRGIGDFRYKSQTDRLPQDQIVTPVPAVSIRVRNNLRDDVLLLGSRGLWGHVASDEQAIERVRDLYDTGEVSAMLIAEEVVHGALVEGKSKENISAIVAILPAAAIGPAENGGVEFIRCQRKFFDPSYDYDMYDNIKDMPKIEPAPGSVFFKEEGEDY